MRRKAALVVVGSIIFSAVFLACVGDDPATGSSSNAGDQDGAASADGTSSGGDGSTTSDGSILADGGVGDACVTSPCIVEVSAGGAHTCARVNDGTVRCWGVNNFGQLGSGTVFDNGDASFTVAPAQSFAPLVVPGITNANVLGTGGSFAATGVSCVNLSSGSISCWGANNEGQLGRGSSGSVALVPNPPFPVPANVVSITNAISIGTGVLMSCAVLQGGTLACWGGLFDDELGQTHGADSVWNGTPVIVNLAGGHTATKVAVAGEHACVLTDDKKIQCWGENSGGANGPPTGTNVLPQVVTLPEDAVDVDVGREFSCALGASGAAYCWGEGGHLGRSPNDPATDSAAALVALPSGVKAVQITSGSYNSCVLTDTKDVYCWGNIVVGTCVSDDKDAAAGVLPNGSQLPVKVDFGGKKPVHLDAGHCHVCALLEGGEVACWGKSHNDQLGRAPETDAAAEIVPQVVKF